MKSLFKRILKVALVFSFLLCSLIAIILLLSEYPVKYVYSVTCNWNQESFATSSIKDIQLTSDTKNWTNEQRTVAASKCFRLAYEASTTTEKISSGEFQTPWPVGFTEQDMLNAGGVPVDINYTSADDYVSNVNKFFAIDLGRADAFSVTRAEVIRSSVFTLLALGLLLVIGIGLIHLMAYSTIKYIVTGKFTR